MPEDANYDPSRNRRKNYYKDANNLCKYSCYCCRRRDLILFILDYHFSTSDGWAMSRYLPYRDIAFCSKEELQSLWTEFSENKGCHIAEDADVGYALEVTLRFPEDKMDYFREYPPLR